MFKEFRGLFLLKEVPTSEGFEKINPIKGYFHDGFIIGLSLFHAVWQNMAKLTMEMGHMDPDDHLKG